MGTSALHKMLAKTETLVDQMVKAEHEIDEQISKDYEKLTEGINDEGVKAEVRTLLRKRAEARQLREKAERTEEIKDKARTLMRMLEDEDSFVEVTEAAPDNHTALPSHGALPAASEEWIGGEDKTVTSEVTTDSGNLAGLNRHGPGDGTVSEQSRLTTPEEVLVSAAVGPYAAKLLRGIEVIKKLRAENAECSAERSVLRAEMESLKRDAVDQATRRQAVQAEFNEFKAAQRERDNEDERERELECESWATAVSQLQMRNDYLTEALNNANTRTSAARAREIKLEAELMSWHRFFEGRSLCIGISGAERALYASVVDDIQKVLWPEIETDIPSSASSVTDGARTPSTMPPDW